MLRLLLQLLGVLGAPLVGLAADAPGPIAVADPPVAGGLTRVSIDASFLPAATGWFLVPVTLAKDSFVDVDARYASGPGTTAAVILGRAEGARAFGAFGWVGRNAAEVNREGERVGCCDAAPLPKGGGRDGLGRTEFFRAGETVWVGLAAVGWGADAAMRVNLTAAEPVLQVGAARKGTAVELVDLLDEARRDGTNVRVAGGTLLGQAGNGTRAWTPKGTGLLVVDAGAAGNASARLHVALPNGTLMEAASLHRNRVHVAALQEGGQFELRLQNVRDVQTLGRGGDVDALHARALYADLDASLDGFSLRIEPVE